MHHNIGLTDADVSIITEIMSRFPHVEKAIIFGSRAKGTFKPGSDVDIALMGRELCFDDITRISLWLNEETILPYKFDIVNYHTPQEPALIAHIDRVGIVLFSGNEEKQPELLLNRKESD